MADRVVLIGASGGIGQYLIESLSDFKIYGTWHKHKPAGDLMQLDVTNPTEVEEYADWVCGPVGGKRVVVINASGITINGMGHNMPINDWQRVVSTNLTGAYVVARAFLPYMRESYYGRIINLASIVGQRGVAGTSAYAASKAGLEGMTRALAVENATKGVTVNSLALGYFRVGIIDSIPDHIRDKLVSTIPMKRLGNPNNIDAAIRFLIDADYVTGATIDINGGLT